MKTTNLFYLLLLIFTFSCAPEENVDINLNAKEIYNISYGADSDQVFDLYLPANRTETSTKTIIMIHGGGWTSGDKADMAGFVNLIRTQLPQYAIANINYRLASVGNPAFPMQIDDISTIISRLKTGNHSISNQYGLIGASAGAHLSMLYGYAFNADNEIKIVGSIVGPTNFTDVNYLNDPTMNALIAEVTGETYENNPTYFEELSPLFRATSASPPTILLYGNADPLVPTTQGVAMRDKLNELGVYNEFTLYNGGHGDWALPDQLDAYNKMLLFIQNKF